ncbi:uncharacterized protein LOC108031503 [Drosophila biarmipes]|uniref:uncharacterized protein LOC108031503 n=1 Tax=Drosophila biarmipes TaxID=125945 RepID=UPI0007E6498C|nr:uncharacterized protein LOC108031503 [Drosophila biarmipes]
MQKPQPNSCWIFLILGSLIATFMLAFSYWVFVPREESFWSIISRNPSGSGFKFSLPPSAVPEELKLRPRPPFVYQIIH